MESLKHIQSELKANKSQFNSFGKYYYRSCEDILEALKPLLKTYNCTLTISDEVKEVGSLVFVESEARIIDNESKEEIFVTAQAGIDINRKGMDVSQCYGSSSSYARKYALNGLFLIDDTKDSDATNDHKKQTIDNTRFEKALETIKQGTYTIEKLKASFELTELQNKALLLL
jgi:ADP-ribosylglycohydrolase